jgi:hypothetical protein
MNFVPMVEDITNDCFELFHEITFSINIKNIIDGGLYAILGYRKIRVRISNDFKSVRPLICQYVMFRSL